MDQPKAKLSTIDGESEPRSPRKVTSTIPAAAPEPAFPPETDSGISSADSSDSVPQVAAVASPCVLRLRLAQTQPEKPKKKRVGFHAGVIDNENMNRRKSKCCCIYRKPHPFGESSSSTDDECENCFGHPEVKARNRLEKLEKLEKRRQQHQNCCSCCRHHVHRHVNRNNRLAIEEIAAEKDSNRDEEEQKSAIKNRNESSGEEVKED